MGKFKTIYNIIISIWQVCSKYKEEPINDDMCQKMYDELNQRAKAYSGAEWKLMANIGTEIMNYLFGKDKEIDGIRTENEGA